MAFLIDLWLPILLSAILVFIASSIIHMVIKSHNKDYTKLGNEDEVLAGMRSQNLKPGDYVFPYCIDMKEMGSEEMQAKYNQGPVGFMTVMPNGMWTMGKTLTQWFLYALLIAVLIAYAAYHALPAGADYMTVFRLVAVICILPYGFGEFPQSIWKGQSWGTTRRFLVDGLVYALLTAGTFAWLWPAAAQ